MLSIVVTKFSVGIGIVGCVSLALGSAALAVLATIQYRLLSDMIWILTAVGLVISVFSKLLLFFVKVNSVTIVTSILLLPCCVGTGWYAIHEMTLERYACYAFENFCTAIVAASCAAFVFTILEFGIILCIWRNRTASAKLDKCASLGLLEENGEEGYEHHHSPVGDETSSRSHWTQSTLSREIRQRPRSKVGLWNDDAITTARIPREKIEVGDLISQGGYGEVYKGTFNGLTVAVKKMLPANRKSVSHVNNFLTEIKLMASLDHPCIVQFVGVAWDSLSDVCAVTEFMDGGDLRGLLSSYDKKHNPVGFDDNKVKIALHVAHALTYLHSLSPVVIHRDLKSRNILLTSDLDAKLTDFGVSRERADHTMTAGVGTSLWMAPEVLMGERYDDKADVFSFGVVLSELDLQVLPYSHAVESDGSGRRMRDTAILQRMAMGKLRVQFSHKAIASMVDLGNLCVCLNPADRPSAAEVLYKLQIIQREFVALAHVCNVSL